MGVGEIRTKVIFTDLPYHCEYLIPLPMLEVGVMITFDSLSIPDKKNREKERIINGEYYIKSVKLVYKTSEGGLTQFLEVSPIIS